MGVIEQQSQVVLGVIDHLRSRKEDQMRTLQKEMDQEIPVIKSLMNQETRQREIEFQKCEKTQQETIDALF